MASFAGKQRKPTSKSLCERQTRPRRIRKRAADVDDAASDDGQAGECSVGALLI